MKDLVGVIAGVLAAAFLTWVVFQWGVAWATRRPCKHCGQQQGN
jgi:high-affinity Fe2+/Pb2+ permease